MTGIKTTALYGSYELACTCETCEVDGLIFFPPSGIHLECLIPSEQTFDGGWKGVGNLYHINIPDDFLLNAVVSFPRPKPSAYVFEGYFAFLKDVHLMHSDSRNQKG